MRIGILSKSVDVDRMLCGDDTGRLFWASRERLAGVPDDARLTVHRLPAHYVGSYSIPIPFPLTTNMPSGSSLPDWETVPLQKIIIDGRYMARIGYGPKTRTWIISGEVLQCTR